jgi:hypothetical protein
LNLALSIGGFSRPRIRGVDGSFINDVIQIWVKNALQITANILPVVLFTCFDLFALSELLRQKKSKLIHVCDSGCCQHPQAGFFRLHQGGRRQGQCHYRVLHWSRDTL